MLTRRRLISGLAATLIPRTARAQYRLTPPRVGWLSVGSEIDFLLEAFRDGLRKLGYVEGRNVVIAPRYAKGSLEALRAGADELAELPVALVVVSLAMEQAARVIKNIPIVFISSSDPVEAGLAHSLSHPGGNVTGSTLLSLEAAGKRVQLMKKAVPHLRTLAAVSNIDQAGERAQRAATETAARALGINLVYVPFSQAALGGSPELGAALEAVRRAQPDAMLVFPDGVTLAHCVALARFAGSHRLPTIFGWMQYLVTGGLMSYGPSLRDAHMRLATYVDKILNGARPADLPIEQPTRSELVINAGTAKMLGLTLPQSLLLRADQVIDTSQPPEPIRVSPLAL